jgi:hypothetical protein
MNELLQFVGALLILLPFAAVQMGRTSPAGVVYLVCNLVGSLVLGVIAVDAEVWGFVVLEVVWALASVWGLARRARGLPVAGSGAH